MTEDQIVYPRSIDNAERDIGFAMFDGESKNLPCEDPKCPDRLKIIHHVDCPRREECHCPMRTMPNGNRRQDHQPNCYRNGSSKKCTCKPLGDHKHHTYVLLSVGHRKMPNDVEFGFRPCGSLDPDTLENCIIKTATMFGGPMTFYNIVNPHGLSTEDCLNFIIRHAVKNDVSEPPLDFKVGALNKICVGFRFGYDVTMIFKPKSNVPLKININDPDFKFSDYEITNIDCPLQHPNGSPAKMHKLSSDLLFCPSCGWTTVGSVLKSIFVDEKQWTDDSMAWTHKEVLTRTGKTRRVWDDTSFRFMGMYPQTAEQAKLIKASYTPNKKLCLKYGATRINVDDVWGFFQGSFEGALKTWGAEWVKRGYIKEGEEIPAKIHYGKTHRSEFESWDIKDLIEYNNLELEYGIYLMETFAANLEVCKTSTSPDGINLCTKRDNTLKYKMHGAGAIGGFFLDKWNAKKHHWGGERGEGVTETFESMSQWTTLEMRSAKSKSHTKQCKRLIETKQLHKDACKCTCHKNIRVCNHCHIEPFKEPLKDCPHNDHLITWEIGSAEGARRSSYYGARIELFKRGKFPHDCKIPSHNNRVWHADINSAYPTAMQFIPSIHSKWDRFVKPSIDTLELEPDILEIRDIDGEKEEILHVEKLKFGCVAVEWFLPSDTVMGPFPFREDTGHVRFPPHASDCKPCTGTYFVVEVWTAMQAWVRQGWKFNKDRSEVYMIDDGTKYYIRLLKAWILRPPYEYPFREPVREMFDKRRALKDAKNAAEKVLKLGLNSFYGRQAIRPTKRDKNPQSRELFFSGFDTAYARSQLLWYGKPREDYIIAFQTDGLYGLERLNVPEGKRLGEYEIEHHDEGVFILAGVYAVTLNHEELQSKCQCRTSLWGELQTDGEPVCKQPCSPQCLCSNSCACHWSYRIRGYAMLDVRHIYDEQTTPHHADCPKEPHSICQILRGASAGSFDDPWNPSHPILELEDERFIPIRLGMATLNANRLGEFMMNPRSLNWDSNQKRLFTEYLCSNWPYSADSVAQSSTRTASLPYRDRVTGETDDDLLNEAEMLTMEYV